MKNRDILAKSIRGILIIVTAMITSLAATGHAATTLALPEYRKPILDPSSQTSPWTNVIPNALASYYTYVPYSNADAVKLGFPASCGNKSLAGSADKNSTDDCYTITVKKFQQALDLHGIFGGGTGLQDGTGAAFGPITWAQGYGSGGQKWAPPGAPTGVVVTGNAPAPFTDGTFGTTGIWHWPAPTVKAAKGRPVRIQWLNELPNEKPTGFDPTICDGMPMDCFPYNRIVTHVHGAHVGPESDGFANAWFTPGFAAKGPAWQSTAQYGPEGTYFYPMDQEAGTIWYHDHAMGLTHDNTNMGMAGFFPITDDNEKYLQGLAPGSAATKVLPTGDYELGFALQDRQFYTDGQQAMYDAPIIDARDIVDPINLANPLNCTYTYQLDGTITPNNLATCTNTPKFMKDLKDGLVDHHLIPYVAGPGVTPLLTTSTSLEFFGRMPVVNGVVYGKYDVEPRVYRMRFIGGTDSRTWIPRLRVVDPNPANPPVYIPFYQIGTEQGLLNKPMKRDFFLIMPGERVDVLVDLSGLTAGQQVMMDNLGPDFPYQGAPVAVTDVPVAYDAILNPDAIPAIMLFNVIALKPAIPDVPKPSTELNLNMRPMNPTITADSVTLTNPVTARNVSLMEITDQWGRIMPTIDARGFGVHPVTELIALGDSEQWDIINTTVDSHPMHLHLVAFQLINREGLQIITPATLTTDPVYNFTPPVSGGTGAMSPPSYVGDGNIVTPTVGNPDEHELGWKDTIMCPPGVVTRVKAKFDIPGMYVWHCHILSHEEHDMMRPMVVTTPATGVTLAASTAGLSQPSGSAAPVTFMAAANPNILGLPQTTGFEYKFTVTPQPPLTGTVVSLPLPPGMMVQFAGTTAGYAMEREAVWTPPTVPGTYRATVYAKALGAPASAAVSTFNDYIIAPPGVAGATSSNGTGFYKAGTSVNVSIAFNQAITSTGLAIALNNGVTLNTGALANVTSFSGSFTVAAGQDTPAGKFLDISAITGTITDVAGNSVTNPVVSAGANISNSVSVVIDTVAPVTTATPGAGTYGSSVSVALKANESATIYYTLDGSTPSAATSTVYSGQIVLSSPTTTSITLRYFAVDNAKNAEAAVNSGVYNLHVADLTAKVAINNGKGYTNSVNATLSLSASDPVGVSAYAISTDNVTYLATVPISPAVKVFSANSVPVTLPTGDGLKTVYVKFTDALGVVYPPVSAQIILETALPVVAVTPGGGDYAGKVTVALSSPNEPEGATIYYTTDGSTPSPTSRTTKIYRTPFTLSGMSTTTTTTVTVKYFAADFAGNIGAVQSTVYRFVANPDMITDVNINNDAPYTNSRNVLLKVSAQDPIGGGVATMSFSNDGVTFTTPASYLATKAMPWTLTAGDALKTVYFRFTDKGTPGVAPITYTFTAKIFLAEGVKLATGDVNGDGKVDLTDSYLALLASSGLKKLTIAEQARGDVAPLVNGIPMPDGAITSGDVLVITKKVLGLISF